MLVDVAVEPAPHLFTVDDYHAMADAGVFAPDARVELIEGAIIEMAPIGPGHASSVGRLNMVLTAAVAGQAFVWVQSPIAAGVLSEPQPDIAVLRPRDDYYARAHARPEEVLLVIEVADSSLAFDRRVKLPMYARSGIAEVWIVDVKGRTIEVHRRLGADGYTETFVAGPGDVITPLTLTDVAVPVVSVVG
ncbi:MAG: Uma2 family endonuclease [Acidimicrobiales bacterium]